MPRAIARRAASSAARTGTRRLTSPSGVRRCGASPASCPPPGATAALQPASMARHRARTVDGDRASWRTGTTGPAAVAASATSAAASRESQPVGGTPGCLMRRRARSSGPRVAGVRRSRRKPPAGTASTAGATDPCAAGAGSARARGWKPGLGVPLHQSAGLATVQGLGDRAPLWHCLRGGGPLLKARDATRSLAAVASAVMSELRRAAGETRAQRRAKAWHGLGRGGGERGTVVPRASACGAVHRCVVEGPARSARAASVGRSGKLPAPAAQARAGGGRAAWRGPAVCTDPTASAQMRMP